MKLPFTTTKQNFNIQKTKCDMQYHRIVKPTQCHTNHPQVWATGDYLFWESLY